MNEWFETGAMAVDGVAVIVMLMGFAISLYAYLVAHMRLESQERLMGIQMARCQLGAYLAFGLELMIISDLLHTIVSHALEELAFLGALVLIRTLIGYFLNKEIQELKLKPESA